MSPFSISHDLVAGKVFEDLGPRPVVVRDEKHLEALCGTKYTSHYLANRLRVPKGSGRTVYVYCKKLKKVVPREEALNPA